MNEPTYAEKMRVPPPPPPHTHTGHLTRFFTVCFTEYVLKFGWNCDLQPNNPYIRNGFVELIRVGNSIRHINRV